MDFETGLGQTPALKFKCIRCVPYSACGDRREKPEFCRGCGCLLQRSAIANDLFEQFVSSPVFSSEEWGVDPELLLSQMFDKETKISQKPKLPSFCSDRNQLVQYLEAFCRHNDLKISTFVLGLRLFDEVCTKINFMREELTLIAMQVLSMAAKIEEHPNVFPLAILIKLFTPKFSVQQIIFAEKIIFKILNFKLRRETILDFLYFYLSRGIVSVSEMTGRPALRQLEIIKSCESSALRSAVQIAKKFEATMIEPSKVAAAVVWCSRKNHGFKGWPIALALMTRVSESELESIYTNLFRDSISSVPSSLQLSNSHQPIQIKHASRSPNSTDHLVSPIRQNSNQPSLGSNDSNFNSSFGPCNFSSQSTFDDLLSKDSIHCQVLPSETNSFLTRIQTSN